MVESKIVRVLLWPLAWLYGAVVALRGLLYDAGWLRSAAAAVPTLVVGNLSVGGTGKSPMACDVLQRLAIRGIRVALLSRGYGRRTRGFRYVDAAESVASEVGDEPLMLARAAAGACVAVCEDRVAGCARLVEECEGLAAVVLDDAYQHRRLRGKVNVLLTEYSRLYVDDYPLPVGRLRDAKRQARRAEAVVVTKCPLELTRGEADAIAVRLRLREGQMLLFAAVEQGTPYPLAVRTGGESWRTVGAVVGLAGIANPAPFFEWLAQEKRLEERIELRDHQRLGRSVVRRLKQRVEAGRTIVVTEKDAVRVEEAAQGDASLLAGVWVAPIRQRWLFDGAKRIEELLDGLLR